MVQITIMRLWGNISAWQKFTLVCRFGQMAIADVFGYAEGQIDALNKMAEDPFCDSMTETVRNEEEGDGRVTDGRIIG